MGLLLLVTAEGPVTQTAIMTADRGNFCAYQTGMAISGGETPLEDGPKQLIA